MRMAREYEPQAEDDVYEKASNQMAICVQATDRTLLLDFDSKEPPPQYDSLRALVHELFIIVRECRWQSKSGNLHVVLELKKQLDPVQRLALQAALGSDPRREILGVNLSTQEEWEDNEVSFLFRPKSNPVVEVK